ncbi:MAG: alpha/beta fold hydrolase [Pseudomonadota bacterium]
MSARQDEPTPVGDDQIISRLVQAAYDAALDPESFDGLMQAWDEALEFSSDQLSAQDLLKHFERALGLARDPRLDPSFEPSAILSLIPNPALLLDERGLQVAANAEACAILERHHLSDGLAEALEIGWPVETDQHLAVIRAPDGRYLLCGITRIRTSRIEGPVWLIQIDSAEWSEELTAVLRSRFSLTPSEVDVVRLLSLGQSVGEISRDTDRSMETIRSHIKSALAKTGEKKQAGLLQLLTRLRGLLGQAVQPDAAPMQKADFTETLKRTEVTRADGRRIVFSEYGQPDGHCVLYLTTSSCPWETPEWQNAVGESGLRVVAPHRPGFGGSDPLPNQVSLAQQLAEDCKHFLRLHTGQPLVVAGHREGGVLAAEIAGHLAGEFSIKSVVLISTGAPADEKLLGDASLPMRRSLKAAHNMPSALKLGYRVAKGLFESGSLGERRTVDYFFMDSPLDKALVADDYYWRITRDNIAYSFENTDMIADDIRLWTSNWDGQIPVRAVPWLFIHGGQHDFMEHERVVEYCQSREHSHAVTLLGTAQLALYQRTTDVAQTIAGLF